MRPRAGIPHVALLGYGIGCQAAAPPAPPPVADAHAGVVVPTPAPTASIPQVVSAAPPADAPSRRTAIRFEVRGRPFPLPLVDVTVAGLPASMVLDTGATRHVLADWAAREAGVGTQPSKVDVADHTGKRLTVLEADASALRISGWGPVATTPRLLVGSLPDALRSMRIAGILAPQLLGGDGAVVLDMRKGEMLGMAADAARAAYATAGKELARPGQMRGCVTPGGAALYVVHAEIGGRGADLQLDSGAADTDLKEGSAPAKSLAARAVAGQKTYTATGTYVARKLPNVRVVVGEVAIDIDVMLAPAEPRPTCPRDGFLGMDVLRDAVVVLAADQSFVRWRAR